MGMGIGGGYPSPEQYDAAITQAEQRRDASTLLAVGLEQIRDSLVSLQELAIEDLIDGLALDDLDTEHPGDMEDDPELVAKRGLIEGIRRAFSGYAAVHRGMAADQEMAVRALEVEKARLAGLIVVPSLQPKGPAN